MKHQIEKTTLELFINAASAIADEAKIQVKEDSWESIGVDPGKVAMYELSMPEEAFVNYGGKEGVLGFNLTKFKDVIGKASTGHPISIERNEETRKVEFGLGGSTYRMALIDPDTMQQEPDIPDLNRPTTMAVEMSELKTAIEYADMLGETLTFGFDAAGGLFVLEASGDTDEYKLELDPDADETIEDIDTDWDIPTNSTISLEYLKDISNAIPKDKQVVIDLGDEMPVSLDFRLKDGIGNAKYTIAPRIDTN